MQVSDWVNIIVNVLSSLAIIIPLLVKLYQTIKSLTKEQNWPTLLGYAIKYMMQAEQNMTSGAEKKEWVLSSLSTSASNIGYELADADIAKIGDMIDSICDASKTLNK